MLAIALHAMLPLAAPAAAASTDPCTVICHGDGTGPEQTPADDFAPVKVCDHCTLCGTSAFALAHEAVPAGRLVPPRLLHVLRPASFATDADLRATPGLARAPPQAA
jgi:hypothetical protein